ncbi:unnamed protein product [Microthlaspi erraticum]|uniref:Uncharacterized protein n=1 Tax=Microthlaspi erraticum TaxID=1685480 RepID=A0A6D2HHA7_9BRAS|nr:unnamed protein product [Microthlaspi erraticum]
MRLWVPKDELAASSQLIKPSNNKSHYSSYYKFPSIDLESQELVARLSAEEEDRLNMAASQDGQPDALNEEESIPEERQRNFLGLEMIETEEVKR